MNDSNVLLAGHESRTDRLDIAPGRRTGRLHGERHSRWISCRATVKRKKIDNGERKSERARRARARVRACERECARTHARQVRGTHLVLNLCVSSWPAHMSLALNVAETR